MPQLKHSRNQFCSLAAILLAATFLTGAAGLAADPIKLQHRWEVEPNLNADWIGRFQRPSPEIDVSQLTSKVRENRVYEAQRATLTHSNPELDGANEALPALFDAMKIDRDNRQSLLAYTSAVIGLSDGSHAKQLWDAVQHDPAVRLVVEKQLGPWKSSLAVPLWRERIVDPSSPSGELLIAIEGLGEVGEFSDQSALVDLLSSDWASVAIKLSAAKSVGKLVTTGLEPLAKSVTTSTLPQRELLAALLLQWHSSPEAVVQLEEILNTENKPSHATAFKAIMRIDNAKALVLAKKLIKHDDNTVRRLSIETLGASDQETDFRALAFALRDRNQANRRIVRHLLIENAQQGKYLSYIDDVVGFYLQSDFAEGAEQAILICVALEKKEKCGQIVSLLQHPKPQVSVRAGWAMQELAETDAVLEEAMKTAQATTQRLIRRETIDASEMNRAAFLFQAFGRNRYEPAAKMLEAYVPKEDHGMRITTRTAAIWALGRIHENSNDETLAERFAERMLDNTPNDPEDEPVKYASALAIGMIKNSNSVNALQRVPESIPHPIALAAQWAREQIEADE